MSRETLSSTTSIRKMANANAILSAVMGIASVIFGVASLFSGHGGKMMKAPGQNGVFILRKLFEQDPAAYFRNLRGA